MYVVIHVHVCTTDTRCMYHRHTCMYVHGSNFYTYRLTIHVLIIYWPQYHIGHNFITALYGSKPQVVVWTATSVQLVKGIGHWPQNMHWRQYHREKCTIWTTSQYVQCLSTSEKATWGMLGWKIHKGMTPKTPVSQGTLFIRRTLLHSTLFMWWQKGSQSPLIQTS